MANFGMTTFLAFYDLSGNNGTKKIKIIFLSLA
jgi:hypothetical protein